MSNKIKLIELISILKNETGVNCDLSVNEINEKMETKFGKKLNEKTLRNDLETLRLCNFDIAVRRGAHGEKFYSNQFKGFDDYELRLLADAISSARFITYEETDKILKKLKGFTNDQVSKKLENNLSFDERIKSKNKFFKYDIDKIHTAVAEELKITFQYGKYNVKKEFSLNHNGIRYEVKPYSIVWMNDYYYLVAMQIGCEGFKNFRVDRMRDVVITTEHFSKRSFDTAKYLSSLYNMYPGEIEVVELRFKKQLINAVIDKLGLESLNIMRYDDDTFTIRMEAAISDGLIRWILNWGSDAIVLSPTSVIERLKEESKKMFEQYR